MERGDEQSTLRRAIRRAVCLHALIGAVAGCSGESPPAPSELPPLPAYWQGAISAAGADPWTTTAPQHAPPALGTPYVVGAWPGRPGNSTATGAPTEFSPLPPVIEPLPVVAIESDISLSLATPAIASPPAHSVGALLPPQSVADCALPRGTNAPADHDIEPASDGLKWFDAHAGGQATRTIVVPEDVARTEAPLRFPSEKKAHRATVAKKGAPEPGAAIDKPAIAAPTGAVISERAADKTRRGFALAQRGAYFAAQRELFEVLQMIAEAKDQIHGAPRRTIALAEGKKAFDEAVDFAPLTPGADAKLNVRVIVSSHCTPAAKDQSLDDLLPQQIADLYLEFAQQRLGAAVAGEPAGSMALHALGKLHSQLGRVEPEKHPLADRQAFALQQAALLARPDNHLAAHELGVLLAEAGHLAEAGSLLRQVAANAPHPVVYRNLARLERKMGRPDLAVVTERQAEYLAARGDAESPIEWVAPADLTQVPDATGVGSAPMRMVASPAPRQAATPYAIVR